MWVISFSPITKNSEARYSVQLGREHYTHYLECCHGVAVLNSEKLKVIGAVPEYKYYHPLAMKTF